VTLEEFLERLERVQQHGSYYKARCPAHHDHQPSLTVRVKENGWIDPKCWTGCTEEQILDALDLKNIDLLTAATNFGEPTHVWTYQDEERTALFQTLRFPPKRFRARHYDPEHPDATEDGWVWNIRDVRRVLYRLPEVLEGIKKGRTIYLVEGEKDADRLVEAWGVVATCNPAGALKWRAEYSDMLYGATVIQIADRDTPGRKHAEMVRTSLQGKVGRLFQFQSRVGKDVSDHIDAGYKAEDLEPLRKRVRRGVISMKEMAELARDDLTLTELDIPAFVLSPQVPVQFRLGRTYAVGAYTGHGKTSFGLPGFRTLCEQGHRCGYFTLEMPERDIRNKLLAHKGLPLAMTENPWTIQGDDLRRYKEAVDEIEHWDSDIIFESNIRAQKIREITEEHEYEVIFVDHIHKLSWGDNRRAFEEEVQNLNSIALDLNVLVVLFCQFRKFEQRMGVQAYPRPTLQSFRETSTIGEEASMALGIWRTTNEDGTEFTGETAVFILKNRHTTGREDRAGRGYFVGFDPKREMFVPQHMAGNGTGPYDDHMVESAAGGNDASV
jgi:KaiC/GvpD/RAD55 family RecA-like ATPase